MTKQTPPPWKIAQAEPYDGKEGYPQIQITGAEDRTERTIANVLMDRHSSVEGMANAAFIVRACNSHEKLVGAIKAALAYLNDEYLSNEVSLSEVLHTALAEAEGNQ